MAAVVVVAAQKRITARTIRRVKSSELGLPTDYMARSGAGTSQRRRGACTNQIIIIHQLSLPAIITRPETTEPATFFAGEGNLPCSHWRVWREPCNKLAV